MTYRDPHWLAREYAHRTAADIAGQFGISKHAILYWLHKHGIARRDKETAGNIGWRTTVRRRMRNA